MACVKVEELFTPRPLGLGVWFVALGHRYLFLIASVIHVRAVCLKIELLPIVKTSLVILVILRMAFHAGGESILRMCNGSICLNLLTAVMELHRISKPRMQLELTTICRNIENMSISSQLDARKGCNHNAKTIYENIWTHICFVIGDTSPIY